MKVLGFLILMLFLAACGARQQPSSQTEKSPNPPFESRTVDESKPAPRANPLKGKVLERLDAGRYSYLRLSSASGEIWAAVLQAQIEAGEEVSIVNPIHMDGFESKTLNRKFDRIVFGALDQQSEQADTMQSLYTAHAGVSESAVAEPISVEKAAGPEGRTVAEIFSQKLKLKDRRVAVTGRVVKVNANIMERNWIHLHDGTGNPEDKTDDLAVTTRGNANVGDTVLVKGTLRTDRNFGMGYVFPVVVEDATVTIK